MLFTVIMFPKKKTIQTVDTIFFLQQIVAYFYQCLTIFSKPSAFSKGLTWGSFSALDNQGNVLTIQYKLSSIFFNGLFYASRRTSIPLIKNLGMIVTMTLMTLSQKKNNMVNIKLFTIVRLLSAFSPLSFNVLPLIVSKG